MLSFLFILIYSRVMNLEERLPNMLSNLSEKTNRRSSLHKGGGVFVQRAAPIHWQYEVWELEPHWPSSVSEAASLGLTSTVTVDRPWLKAVVCLCSNVPKVSSRCSIIPCPLHVFVVGSQMYRHESSELIVFPQIVAEAFIDPSCRGPADRQASITLGHYDLRVFVFSYISSQSLMMQNI